MCCNMDIEEIAKKLKENGANIYLVGGAVRDEIMGLTPHDKDYCVTGIEINKFHELFPMAKIDGKDFPVFRIENMEIALARSEEKISAGYKGFKVHTSADVTIEQDLKRRDLTINAIAKEVLTGKIIDPFNGIGDIQNKVIRHVSNAFSEDPLRVYRAARFATKFEFEVNNSTITLMNKLKDELDTISVERVFVELRNALETAKPSIFFKTLKRAGVLDVHFKEINNLVGKTQPQEYHPEGDAFEHSMIVLDRVSKKSKDVTVRFAALVHDLGKGLTDESMLPHHFGHEEKGIYLVRKMAKRLKLPNSWRKKGIEACNYHMKASIIKSMRPYKQAMFLNTIYRSNLGLRNLQIIVDADDMLDREKIDIESLYNEVTQKVNANKLIEKGITVQNVGVEKFNTTLFEEQAKIIKEIEKNS